MGAPRGAAHDPRALMAEAAWWRENLAGDPDETVPLLIAWTAWRWADAARDLIEYGGRQHQTVAVLTLLTHARLLLDLLDAGRAEGAISFHAHATHGAEVLSADAFRDNVAFVAWAQGKHRAGQESAGVLRRLASALRDQVRPGG